MTRWKRAWVVDSTPGRTIRGALAILPTYLQVWLDGLALLVISRPIDEEFLPTVKEISKDEAVGQVIDADHRMEAHDLVEKEADLNISSHMLKWPMEPKEIFYIALVRSIRKSLAHSVTPNMAEVLRRLEQTVWKNLYYSPNPGLIRHQEFRSLPHHQLDAAGAEFVEKLFDARLGLKPWNPELQRELQLSQRQTVGHFIDSVARLPSNEMEKELKFRTFMEMLKVVAPNVATDCLSLSSLGDFCCKRLCVDYHRVHSFEKCVQRRDFTLLALRLALKRLPFLFQEHVLSGSLPGQSSSFASTDQSSSLASTELSNVEQIKLLPSDSTEILDLRLPRVKIKRLEDDLAPPCAEQSEPFALKPPKILDLSLPRAKVDASALLKRKATDSIFGLEQP